MQLFAISQHKDLIMRSTRNPLFLFVFFVFSGIKLAQGLCSGGDKYNLLQLKKSWNLNSLVPSKLVSWNSSDDCCSWAGVTCSNGHVTELDLSFQSLSGKLDNSSTLFDLEHLQNLNLAFNQFSSTIPSDIGKLVTLISLNLSNSGFTGQIPIEISFLPRLVTLDLSSFHLPEDPSLKLENPNLTMIIQNLSKLRELYLDGVQISANGYEWSQSLSLWLPNLQVMSMSNCDLTGPIHHSLLKLPFLSVINLSQNKLLAPFPEFVGNFSKLTSLLLRNCGLYGNVAEEIFKVTTLETIDLSNNEFLQGSLPVFPLNSSLKSLVLRGTKFFGQVPDSIGRLGILSQLDLSNCKFEGVLPNSMENLAQIVYLDLSNNSFVGLIPPFQGLKKLTKLKLSYNGFSGAVPSNCFQGVTSLVSIDMRNNLFNGTIPSCLLAIPSLQQLDLAFNRFSGQLSEFPNPSSSLLETLYLESNNLEGPITISVFDLPNLIVLSLSFNKFNGTAYLHNIRKLANLNALCLSYNKLTIDVRNSDSTLLSFPPMISRLSLASCNLRVFPDLSNNSKLAYLDLSDNLIEGKIPSWIWGIMGSISFYHLNLSCNFLVGFEQPSPNGFTSSLTVLDLHSNMIRGPIPLLSKFASYIDYSNNSFSSVIPDDIGDFLGGATFFSISGNKLKGNIPESICNGTNLRVLDISNNDLYGIVPPCLAKMSTSLTVLSLAKNNLHGIIPETFPANCNLRTLELSENALEGFLPKTMANCTMIEVLNLGNNQIHDSFPCWLNNFSKLHVLILRNNKFFGSIECPDFDNSWISLQILDLASNHFDDILPSRYFSSWKAMVVNESDSHPTLNQLKHRVYTLSDLYYDDKVVVTGKGLEMELVKILNIFTFIDISNNMFQGQIPQELGHLTALYGLNMSHNSFIGEIPASIGELKQLESLDLSQNKLSGMIPGKLASLTFLSFLNLSFNQLEGVIPKGNQFGTFSEASFLGNKALCGPPLTEICSNVVVARLSPSDAIDIDLELKNNVDSCFLGAEVGFVVGFGIVIGPPMFWNKWRKWYDEKITDRIIFKIFPQLQIRNHKKKANRMERNKGR